jgi:origin recognition complex subunit 3
LSASQDTAIYGERKRTKSRFVPTPENQRNKIAHQTSQSTLEHADYATTERIVHFTATVADQEDRHALPTGLIVAGPSIASHGSFFARLGQRIRVCTGSAYVVLTSGESPNLKTLLKNLIRKVTSRAEDDDDDDLAPTRTSRAGPKVLDFDLEHVQEWLKKNPVKNVVVAIQDSEAFDAKILDEMIDLFSSWLDRIPFILLFGIATSAESFEDRLSGKTLRYLEGQKFDVAQSDEIIEELFSATIAGDRMVLRIGPNIARRIMDRQKDHIQNTQDFSDGLKYAYMSHFYANVATIFICPDTDPNDISHKAYEALRNLPSFRR